MSTRIVDPEPGRSVMDLARAAATDLANARMRAEGRQRWNQEDYNAAVAEYNRLNPEPTMNKPTMDEFTKAYIEAALWSSIDDDGNPLDWDFSVDDLDPETLDVMQADCLAFQAENTIPADRLAQAGYDFWLTRNHHGAGFWDDDWPEPDASALTDAAHAFGGFDLYIHNDQVCHV